MECHTPTHQEWAEITAHIIQSINADPARALIGGVSAMIRIRSMTENGEAVAYRQPDGQAPRFRQNRIPVRAITLSAHS